MPNSVVVSPELFRDEIIPAFGRERATVGTVTRSFPTLEADVLVDRGRLRADPATALTQTTAVASEIDRIGPGQGYLIDNVSNALAVASEDAATREADVPLPRPSRVPCWRRSSPRTPGSVLAATERREHATLRVRGAHRGHLRTIALTKALVIACVGSAVGIVLGAGSAAAVLGSRSLSEAAAERARTSALSGRGRGIGDHGGRALRPGPTLRASRGERRTPRAMPHVHGARMATVRPRPGAPRGGRGHRDRRDPAWRPRSVRRLGRMRGWRSRCRPDSYQRR